MALSPRLIKRRIKSVANTRKITKAMELVSASKMRKAVQLTTASRSYSGTAKTLVSEIRKYIDPSLHAFLSGQPRTTDHAPRTLLIIAASDRGLCGGFNAQILKKALEFVRGREGEVRIVTVGRRAESAVRRAGFSVVASFNAISNAPSFEAAMPVGQMAVNEFVTGSANRVFVAYTDFKSAITQIPTIEQLLPIIPEEEIGNLRTGIIERDEGDDEDDPTHHGPRTTDQSAILFEPSPSYVLNQLLPRLIETRIYQSLLESSASEHSARMMAMKNATENATDMLDDLKFTYNQARQAGITREISEISAGKAALE